MKKIIAVLTAIFCAGFFAAIPASASVIQHKGSPSVANLTLPCPYDNHNVTACAYGDVPNGVGSIPYLSTPDDNWTAYQDNACTIGAYVESQKNPCPFASGSGLNAKYVGKPIVFLFNNDESNCIWANYSNYQTYMNSCGNQGQYIGDMYVALVGCSNCVTYVSVGQTTNLNLNSNTVVSDLNGECLNTGCKLWTNYSNVDWQDWQWWTITGGIRHRIPVPAPKKIRTNL